MPGTERLPLVPESSALQAAAEVLAARWHFPVQGEVPESGYYLALGEEHLALHQAGPKAPGEVFVDFVGGALGHRQRFGGGRGQAIAKAVGLKSGACPTVLDATAGLGRDAYVLASLGCRVRMLERSPIVAALLEDGLRRAREVEHCVETIARMDWRLAEAAAYLQGLEEERPDVVYLDPMFPPRTKAAKVKKGMAAFHELLGIDPDADRLLPLALQAARQRVVVKRPAYAEALNRQAPTMSIKTKKNRFDVYVLKALQGAQG